jgi:hypothetical protein
MPTEMLIRTNLAALWDIFVDTNVKSIAYFSVTTPARFGRMAMNFAQLAGLNVGEWNSASAPAIARIALGSAELIPLVQDRGSRGMTSRRFNRHGHLRH